MEATISDQLPIALLAGLTSAALTVCKTGRDALFFQDRGLFQLPLAYLGIGLASLPAAFVFVQVMKAWGSRPARAGILIFSSLALSAFVPFLESGKYPVLILLFLLIPTLFGLLFASIWLLASEIFENRPKDQAASAFSKIGASSLAGGICGGFLARGLAVYLDPKWLVLLAGGILLVVTGVVVKTHSLFPSLPAVQSESYSLKEGMRSAGVFREDYARTLLFISMAGALAALFIDFQFYASAASATMGSQGNALFFANFYILLNLSALALQLFLAPRIQDRVGLRGGLIVLPLSLLGGATFATAAATAISRSVLRITEGGVKSSIHRTMWEQAFIPLRSGERSFVKIAVDGMGARVAETLGALVILLWLMAAESEAAGVSAARLDLRWMTWTILGTVIIWLWLTRTIQIPKRSSAGSRVVLAEGSDVFCTRFPDQCPCTTEMGKGIR